MARAWTTIAYGLLAACAPAVAAQDFAYLRDAGAVLQEGAAVVDTRPVEACRERSLAGARCLPAEGFLGPNHRLPGERDLLWLLGSAGLRGDETVLVVGQDPAARDFVAGLLYVAGQSRVRVLTEPMARLLESGVAAAPGRERGFTRETVFEAPMRDRLVVLREELRAMRPLPALLDGRPESEYWGETVRAARGGHLPGAISLPALRLRASLDDAGGPRPVLPDGEPVAYGHDAFEGLAYLTLVTAGHGVPVRLYLEGWADWAADGSLPADAVSYPEPAGSRTATEPAGRAPWPALAGAAALALGAFAGGWWMARRRAA
jgi:thiosulfate/3-mercaptopyruvate sulfurtransferase